MLMNTHTICPSGMMAKRGVHAMGGLLLFVSSTLAQTPTKELDVSPVFAQAREIAQYQTVVDAVKSHNKGLSSQYAQIDNKSWRAISVANPLIRAFTHNETTRYLRTALKPYVTEAFISGADGKKVAFLRKTTSWDHSGKAKHDEPMKNKEWRGEIELDESTGVHQVQLSVPVLDHGKPIGSVVLGVSVVKFEKLTASDKKH